MKKLTLTAAAAALVSAGLILSASAQTAGMPQFKPMPMGEKGAKSGTMCWIDTSGGGYFGFWSTCPKKTAKR